MLPLLIDTAGRSDLSRSFAKCCNVLFRPLPINEGYREQVRVDHGGEFALIAAI